jgi:hypothetical protein
MSVPVLSPNNQLNVKGVTSCNISTTPPLSSYPSGTTSTSLGHYHFVDETTKASKHLNVSGISSGGHIFSHASATQSVKELLKIDRDGILTDTEYVARTLTPNLILDGTLSKSNLTFRNDLFKNIASSEAFSFYYNNALNMQLNNSPDNPNIYLVSPTSQSQLSASDLTFNGVSVLSQINDNAKKQVVPQMIVSSPAIYADSSIAPQPSPFLASYGFGGWAYKKESPQAANAKINWYFPFPEINGTVGDLKGLYYQIINSCVNVGDLPFFVVYTRPTGTNDFASWYHSSRVYIPDANSAANQTCQMYANIKSLSFTPNSIGIQNQINMTESTTNGIYLDTDVILFIAFGTNSGSALNNVNFSCSKIGMITDNFSAEFNLL